jgi:glycosyltransferase involved in cell wall biosynthesis
VITTFNQASYIAAALESVLGQTYPLHQVIVVDDGSRDGTPDAIRPYLDHIHYIRQENRGVAPARNTGVAAASGDLIAFLDGDDVWEPEKIEKQVTAAVQHPDAALIAANGVQFERDTILTRHLFGRAVRERLLGRALLEWDCYDALLESNLIFTTSQVVVPRWALARAGESDRRLSTASDWDLYLRLARDHPFVFLSERLVRWRYLDTSASGPHDLRALRWAADEIPILREELHRGRDGRADRIRGLIEEKCQRTAYTAFVYGEQHDRRWARRYLLGMWRRHGSGAFLIYFVAILVPPRLRGVLRRLARKVTGG